MDTPSTITVVDGYTSADAPSEVSLIVYEPDTSLTAIGLATYSEPSGRCFFLREDAVDGVTTSSERSDGTDCFGADVLPELKRPRDSSLVTPVQSSSN